MNWNNILGECFFAALVTSATGTIMFLVWFLCRKFLQNKSPKLVYFMLRWVVVMYVLPITYFAIKNHYEPEYIWNMSDVSKMVFIVDMNNMWYRGLAVIWLLSVIRASAGFIKNEKGKYLVCKNNFDDGISVAQTEFERI